jgi:hypothetical protein
MTQNKNFCTVEYLDEDGHEIIDHAILSTEEQFKLMDEFIHRGVVATIHDHSASVNSLDEKNESDPNTIEAPGSE